MHDESELIGRARQGDGAAFSRLVGLYQPRLLAFLANLLGGVDEAKDVLQEVFLRSYQALPGCDPGPGFKAWIFAIAYRRGIDRIRRRRAFLGLFQRATEEEQSRPAALFGTLEESPLLSPLLRKVSPRERAALSLKYNEGYSAGEIAAMLGCSESTVRVHLLNARRKLRRELERSPAGAAAGEEVS